MTADTAAGHLSGIGTHHVQYELQVIDELGAVESQLAVGAGVRCNSAQPELHTDRFLLGMRAKDSRSEKMHISSTKETLKTVLLRY